MVAIKSPEHSREEFMRRFSYDPETGHFTHLLQSSSRCYVGKRAGTVVGNGYRVWPGALDHINGDKTDNRIANLREATTAENGWNTSLRRNNTSGYKGVSFSSPGSHANGWRAEIRVNNKRIFLGAEFETPEAAHEAYKEAARKLHGEFVRTE